MKKDQQKKDQQKKNQGTSPGSYFKVYRGYRGTWDGSVYVEAQRINTLKQPMGETTRLRHLVFHSPSGFGWGYAGSGPADLALSILADYFGEYEQLVGEYQVLTYGHDSRTVGLHQMFKQDFLANIQDNTWEINSLDIEKWLENKDLQKYTQYTTN